MYAVIESGGKQYRVEVGTELEVELLDVEPGKTITLDRVLLVADGDDSTIGQPVVADASVSAEVVSQKRGPKLISFKYRPKARRRVKKGHRQELTLLRVADITLNGKSAAKSAEKADTAAKGERARLEEAAAAQAAKDAELAAKLAAQSKTPAKKAEASTSGSKTAGRKPADATAKAEAKSGAKATAKAEPKGNADMQDEAKAETATPKPVAKKATTRAKASDADASADKPAPKKTAAKPRATKKDE